MMNKKSKMEIIKTLPWTFILQVVLPIVLGIIIMIISAINGWNSVKGSFENIAKDKKIEIHESTLNKIVSKESIIELGDKAVANRDREAYLKLIRIVENFGAERNIAISEIARIKLHFYSMTSMNGIQLEVFNEKNELIPEAIITTSQLIDNLFFNSQFLFRARSAQLLSIRNENYIPEILLLSMFSETNLEVLRESTLAFEILTGYKSPDFFNPYGCLGFWYENANSVIIRLKNSNNISVIPFQKFENKISTNKSSLESTEMIYWWTTSLEFEQMLKHSHKIENKTI